MEGEAVRYVVYITPYPLYNWISELIRTGRGLQGNFTTELQLNVSECNWIKEKAGWEIKSDYILSKPDQTTLNRIEPLVKTSWNLRWVRANRL